MNINIIKPALALLAAISMQSCQKAEISDIRYIDEYGIDYGTGTVIDGLTWAPVNCGYHPDEYPYGKMYQWGRTDGFKYSGDYIVSGPIAYGEIPDKGVFYTGNLITKFQWIQKNGDSFAFDEGTPWEMLSGFPKNVGNPCPQGWRIPSFHELKSLIANREGAFSTDDNGIVGAWFCGQKSSGENGKIFLPAAGLITFEGESKKNGTLGQYWSSCPYGAYAHGMLFGADFADVFQQYRAYGYSIRCVH